MACSRRPVHAPTRAAFASTIVAAIALGLSAPAALASDAEAPRLSFEPPASGSVAAAAKPASEPTTRDYFDGSTPNRSAWTVNVEPMMWFVGPSGKLRFAGRPSGGSSSRGGIAPAPESERFELNDLSLDATRLRPAGRITLASDLLRFSFSGFDYDLSKSGVVADRAYTLGNVALAQGDRADFKLGLGSYEVTGGSRVWFEDLADASKHPDDAVDVSVGVFVFGGVRLYDTRAEVRSASATSRTDTLFAEPIIGVKGEATFGEWFGAELALSGGALPLGSTSSSSVDLTLAFLYRPWNNVGVQIGYRTLFFFLRDGKDDDKFQFDGALQGLFLGLTVRF